MTNTRERIMIGRTPAGIRTAIQTDSSGNLAAVDQGGVPANYTRSMRLSRSVVPNPGQLNKIRLRPTILNEHAESSREAMDTVTSSAIIGQIFRASQDNINSIGMTLESAEAETTIDDIEQANDTALQTDWVASNQEAVLETTIVSPNKSSTKSMKLDLDTLNDTWTNSGTWDMSGATIEFDYYQTIATGQATVTLSINDGSNTSVITISVAGGLENSWQHFSVPVSSMTGTANVAAVTNVFFQVTQLRPLQFAYVDNMRFRPAPGSVELKLWDCGPDLPVGDGASFDLTSDATQYTTIGDLGIGGTVAASLSLSLIGGRQLYHIEGFVAGAAKEIPDNAVLTVDNYYAITLHHVDTDVTVYGPDTTLAIDYYTSGYAFSTPAEGTDITKINGANGSGAYSDLMFFIFSVQDSYIDGTELDFFASGGELVPPNSGTSVSFLVEDSSLGMNIGHIDMLHGMRSSNDTPIKRPVSMSAGGKVEAYISVAADESAAHVTFIIDYHFILPTIHG